APATATATNQTSSRCRIVTYNGPEGGLAIRNQPDRNAPRIDGVNFGQKVTLRTSPPPSNVDKDGRDWVEVVAPSRGWVSNGFPSSQSANLGLCP
ncbi:MAG TPA: SH3 domain-containing protein, partial [Cyanobacteria bacterium UBA8543]|nr:SH3 domain-containing protein [Cyanobacteria bacterium UBA8543]